MNKCIYCGAEISDSTTAMMHANTTDCLAAVMKERDEWRRKFETLLESVKYLRKDVPNEP